MELTYQDYMQRLSVQDVLRDMGYVRNRKDGMRYPSFVRLDEHGQRIRGDKFIVTRDGQFCFHPPVQKNYNVISLIKEHPHLFPEYEVGMNLDKLVNKVCHRLLNTPYEEKEAAVKEPQPELKPFDVKDYKIHVLVSGDRESAKPFYPYFRHRGLDLNTQYAFSDFFVLADRNVPGRKGSMIRNLSFPITVPGGDGTVVGFEERGRPGRDGKAYKGKAAGSNGSLGLWIASPSGTSLKDAEKVLVFESAYDAMAYYQLHRDSDRELKKAVFASTGGNPTRGQMQGLIRTAPGAAFHLCFDNDEAGRQFTANFMTVAKEMKPYSDVARAYKDTPGFIETDHEKESAFFKLPKEVKEQYFKVEGLREDLREGYLCQEDKDELKAQIAQGWRVFNEMVDACIVHVERELPGEGYKDFNDELLGRETTERKAVGCDLDGDGAVETEESHEERHRYHR
jgi:hypothetical protein